MMIRVLIAILLVLGITTSVESEQKKVPNVVLPNHGLVRSNDSGFCGLWEDVPQNTEAVYPTQLTLDIRGASVHVVVARYDKSVSIQDIQSAINARYSAWALPESPTTKQKLWRVMSEKFAISLDVVRGGIKEVYYFSIEGKAAGAGSPPNHPN